MKSLIFGMLLLMSCDKEPPQIAVDPCKTCTQITKVNGVATLKTAVFEECNPVKIDSLEHTNIIWVIMGNTYSMITNCE